MILRRVIGHVKDQNWVAIGIDFVIVVSGVVLGIQVTNWNEAAGERQAYREAQQRYLEEAKTNLASLDLVDQQTFRVLNIVGDGFDALLTCEDTPENVELVEAALLGTMGTSGVRLHQNALRELTENEALLSQQTPEERLAYATTRYRLEIFLREADFIEVIPLEERTQNNPLILIGPQIDRETEYAGVDYSRRQRSLKLGVPVDVACRDNMLIKSFYTWERWQSTLPAVTRILRETISEDVERLER